MCEVYSFEKRIPYHLDYRSLAGHRAQLGCERIVVTHMSEDMLARLGEIELDAADDGLVIEL